MDQTGWTWCQKCQGLYYAGNPTPGVCPAGGGHDGSGSGHYVLDLGADAAAHPQGQSQWSWCQKCQGLCYGPQLGSSVCPAGGPHDGSASGDYTLDTEAGPVSADDQRGWRWCSSCQGLFFAGNPSSTCPAGGAHNGSTSGAYVVRMAAATVPARLLLSPFRISGTTLLLGLLQNAPVFALDQETAIAANAGATITSEDGRRWCQLDTWVDWPNSSSTASWQCRASQLTITLPRTVADADVLQISPGFPQASLALPNDAQLPLTAAVDAGGLRLAASFTADAAGRQLYDAAIGALSNGDSGGPQLTIATSHYLAIRDPAATPPDPGPVQPPQPRRWPGRHFPVERQVREVEPFAGRLTADAIPVKETLQPILWPQVLVDAVGPGSDLNRRIFLPPPPPPDNSQPAPTRPATVAQQGVARLPWRPQSDATAFPDIPRSNTTGGWLQVTPAGSTRSLSIHSGSRPELFYYIPTAYKLAVHARDDGTGAPPAPMRVTMARPTPDHVTISVTLTAMPYLADADRAELRKYLVEQVLGQSYIELVPATGLTASFRGDFLSEGAPVAASSIRYQLAGAATSELLAIEFTMDELDYGLLVPMIERGITGAIVLTGEDNFTAEVPVDLRLDDVITNAIGVAVAPVPDDPPMPYVGSVTLTNHASYPIRMERLDLALVSVGDQSDIVFDTQQLSLLAAPLEVAAGATSAPLTYTPTIPVWTQTSIVPGVTALVGPAPSDWINAVNRDPSMAPTKLTVTLSPSVPASAVNDVRAVTVSVFDVGSVTARKPPVDISPAHDSPLEVDLTLSDLAGGVDVRSGYFLEFSTRYANDTRSLPQRIALDLSRSVLDLIVFVEPAAADYYVDSDTTVGPLTRAAAQQVIDTLRAGGRTWTVRAVPQPAPAPTG